jgi:translocation and assembly module TamA
MKKILILFLFFVSLFAKEFKTLEFRGDIDSVSGDFTTSTLYGVIGKPYPPFYTPWRDDPIFSDKELKKYKKLISEYYKSKGYYKVKVSSQMLDDKIVITIKKNSPIKIASIKIAPDKNLEKYLPFKEGDNFTTEAFKESKKIIQRKFLEYGFPRYKFSEKAYVDIKKYRVDIDIKADKGKRVYLGKTIISGNQNIKEAIIKDALTFKEGDAYDIRELEKSFDNLYEYGVFDYIAVEPRVEETDATKVPVDVKLKIGDTKYIKNSIGYNTDTGFRGSASWTNKNFFGDMRVFEIGIKADEEGYEVYNTFYDPYIIAPILGKVDFKNEINYHDRDYKSYVEQGWVNRATIGKKYLGFEHHFGLLTESNTIETKVKGSEYEDGNYFLNALFYDLLLDKRDSKVNATKGYYLSLYIEKSQKPLGSDLNYLKTLLDVRYIKSFYHDKITFGIKSRVGRVDRDVPTFKRFYSGGSIYNRGYNYLEFGKKDINGVAIGGISLVDILTEVRYTVIPKFQVALFRDSSKLSLKKDDFGGDFKDSYGFGFRYISPIGPIRLDFGFPKEDRNDFVFHIGVGQVF